MLDKIYRSTAQGVVQNLMQIFNENQLAQQVVEKSLKAHPKWGSKDRRFVARCTYEMVRNWRKVKILAGIREKRIQNEPLYWQLFGTWLRSEGLELPNWDEFALSIESTENLELSPKQEFSFPNWLYEYGADTLGKEKWDQAIKNMHYEAPVFLRADASPENILESLALDNIKAEQVSDYAIMLVERKSLSQSKAWKKGLFEIQDLNSQKIVDAIPQFSPKLIIDACAGAGGKTLQLALKFPNASVVAMDIHENKLKELKKRALRLNLNNITTLKNTPSNLSKFADKADLVLLDVPCSGSGTFRRNIDAKWKLKPEFLDKIQKTQATILKKHSELLKANGLLVYATCSLFPAENEQQVKHFLEISNTYRLIQEEHLWPDVDAGDGFYWAQIKKSPAGS